ncbi:hypothetical protein VFPPC_03771 [Pochonia chlamydosporia 170]|uniref:Uncharacterized protein n=1 Tax=Pochonia chlamydosporia 170 TaxID=1380566 RepID=A0A179F253_METCM|nr:hypothetical protein VFPPC_03771 [Pochonia chlamydosporia 170]OAQ59537.1 hypothetical protein VFPPC_03771 [Pochonia chlamydosporia 170]
MITVIACIAAVGFMVSPLGHLHFIHSLSGGCRRRTTTSSQAVFTLSRYYVKRNANYVLSERDIIIFDFHRAAPNVFIEVPTGSRWYSVPQTHHTVEACISIRTRSGVWFIGSMIAGQPVLWGPELPDHWMYFAGNHRGISPSTAEIIGSKQSCELYHTIASVEQDAEAFFSLCTTPLWVRLLYTAAGLFPLARAWLVHKILWIQLRMIFYKNDYWESHGACYFFRWFYWMWAPQWVQDFEDWSEFAISYAVQWSSYWTGRLLLGMREFYPEYAMDTELEQKL